MPRNLLKYFLLIIYISHGNSCSDEFCSFLDTHSLEKIVENISEVFQNMKRPTITLKNGSYYDEIFHAIEIITSQTSWIEISPDFSNLFHLYEIFHDNLENEKDSGSVEYVFPRYFLHISYDFIYNQNILATMKRLKDEFRFLKFTHWVEKLNDLTFNNGSKLSFFSKVFNFIQLNDFHHCSDQVSRPRQYFEFGVWFAFVSSLLKGFIIDNISNEYQYASSINGHNLTRETNQNLAYGIRQQEKLVKSMLHEYDKLIRVKYTLAERTIENCDAHKFIRDMNFIELERLFQLVVVHCQSCEGVLRECQDSLNIEYCPEPKNTSRRYKWISMESGNTSFPDDARLAKQIYGNFTKCDKIDETIMSQSDIIFENTCRNWICICEENRSYSMKSTFIISSELEESDVTRNMVITGVRFVKKDKIIYTQIRQGELMAVGQIRPETQNWKPVKTIERNNTKYELKSIIISSELKSVNLNDLKCPEEYQVVTGVGLRVSQFQENSNRIVLTISCHLANFKKGKILSSNGTGPFEDKKPHPNKLKIGGLPPDRVKGVHLPDSSNDQFVEISMSDVWKDAGQSVIPWFDAQNVIGTRSVPLSGIGLYHRGSRDSGGFLAYRLLSIDYSLFLRKFSRVDPYAKERRELTISPPQHFCASRLARTMCIVCNASYGWSHQHRSTLAPRRLPRGITDECCTSKCSISNLREYCGPYKEDISDLVCN